MFAQNTIESALLSAFKKHPPSIQTNIDKDDLVTYKKRAMKVCKKALISTIEAAL